MIYVKVPSDGIQQGLNRGCFAFLSPFFVLEYSADFLPKLYHKSTSFTSTSHSTPVMVDDGDVDLFPRYVLGAGRGASHSSLAF